MSVEPIVSKNMVEGTEYELLNQFVGEWSTEGKVLPTDTTPEIKIYGTDTYEWLPGGYFLLHKVDVLVGEEKNETLEIIGYDVQHKRYTLQHYDNSGNSGSMTATCEDGVWNFLGDSLRFKGGFKQASNEFSGFWERLADGKHWVHFMDIKLIRQQIF